MIGTTLAHYRITAALGAGGMGEVWRAEDSKLGREVALKVLSEEFASDPQRLDRFEREARAVAALNHPHIVIIYSVEEAEGIRFLTMELIEGRCLNELIPEGGLELGPLFELATPLAEAISAAHDKSIVHRDLKPSNVMVDADGRVKVLDFGLAKHQGGGEVSDSSELPTEALTGVGMIVGTVPYMSPEQIEGKIVDHRTDVFSLGVLLYEMTTGERPFQGESSVGLMSSILRDAPAPVGERRNDLPNHLGRIISRCLEKDRRDRYQTARDVFNELKALRRESGTYAARAVQPMGGPARTAPLPSSSSADAMRGDVPWIAVLPFGCPSGDADIEGFADGLEEDIATGLSRFSYLFVVARKSTRRYRGEAADVRQVGEELGARYVIEGGIRRAGSRIRIGINLIDTASGTHLWSETYDRDFDKAGVFDLQDEITGTIVATVADSYGILVHSIEAGFQAKDESEYAPWEWVIRLFGYRQRPTPSEHEKLRDSLEAAVEQDPNAAETWACLSQIYLDEHGFGFNVRPDAPNRALAAAQRAVDLNRASQLGYQVLAQSQFFRHDLKAFRSAADRAISLNPRDSNAIGILGLLIVLSGEFKHGADIARRAMELNPNHAGWYHFGPIWESFHNRDWEKALEHAKQVNMPGMFGQHLVVAAACGHLGRIAEAEAALDDLPANDPDLASSIRQNLENWHFASGLLEPLLEGLEKAGLKLAPGDDDPVSVVAGSSARKTVGIAVLPFADMSPEKDQDYFCEGMAEEIMNALVRVEGIRVASRTSAFRAQQEGHGLAEIARLLSVGHVLEGSVRTAGHRLRVTAQLTDVVSGHQLWSERFDRELQDVFAVQDEIAAGVVEAVEARLAPGARTIPARPQACNVEAYRSYLLGQHLRYAKEDHGGAVRAFKEAIRLDPTHAPSWTGLAESLALSAHMSLIPAREACVGAREALSTALNLQGESADGLHGEAFVAFIERRWEALEAAVRRAIELQSTHVPSLGLLGMSLCLHQKPGEAEPFFERAREADPLASFPYMLTALGMLTVGRPQEAQPYAEQALTFEKEDASALFCSSLAKVALGHFEEGIAAAEHGVVVSHRGADFLGLLGWALATAGRKDEARALLEELRGRPATAPPIVSEGWLLGALGEIDAAFEVLVRAENENQLWLYYTGLPAFDPLRGDQRFDALVERLGLPPFLTSETLVSDAPEPSAGLESVDDHGSDLAVAPFECDRSDPELYSLAAGLEEELTSSFAQFAYLQVRESDAFAGVGASASGVGEVWRAAGVRYLVTGRLLRVGDTLRLSVRLLDTAAGRRLWSANYDSSLSDFNLLELQDHLSDRVVATVADSGGVLVRSIADRLRSKALEDYNPIDWVMRTFAYWNQMREAEHEDLREGLEAAVECDPHHSAIWACLAQTYLDEYRTGFNPRNGSLDRALEAALKAVELDPRDSLAQESLADVHFFRRDLTAFRLAADRALAINPRDATTTASMGTWLALSGELQRGFDLTVRAMEMNPDHGGWYQIAIFFYYFDRDEFEMALAASKSMNMPDFFWSHLMTAAAAGKLGLENDARAAVRRLEALFDEPVRDSRREAEKFIVPENLLAKFLDGLQKAGLDASIPGAGAPTPDAGHARIRQTPLVGREAERANLDQMLDEAVAGRGGLVLLGGEPGVGKTRLASEILEDGRERGMLPLTGHAYEDETAPFVMASEILEEMVRLVPADDLRRMLGANASEIARLLPELRTIYNDIPEPADVPPEMLQRHLFKNVLEFLSRAAGENPLVMLLDDIHWADESSLLLLEHITPRLAELPILMIGTYRDVEADIGKPFARSMATLVRQRQAERIHVEPFDEASVTGILAALGGSDPPPELVRAIHKATEGNVFFIEEVFRHLAEEGLLFDETGGWLTAIDVEHLDVPEGVRIVTARRLERLTEATRNVLSLASVIGLRFEIPLLEAAGPDGDSVLEAVEEAEAAHILQPAAGGRELRYEFVHALARQTLLGELSPLRQQRMHLTIADAIERTGGKNPERHAADLAHHLVEAGSSADPERVVRWLMAAGENAVAATAMEEAVDNFDKALSMAGSANQDLRAQLLRMRGPARLGLGDSEGFQADLFEAFTIYESSQRGEVAAETASELAYILAWTAQSDRAHDVVSRALDLIGETESRERCRLLSAQGLAHSMGREPGDPSASKLFHEAAVAMARQVGDPHLLAETLQNQAMGHWHRLEEAARHPAHEAASIQRKAKREWSLGNCLWLEKAGLTLGGLFEEAAAIDEELRPLAERTANFGALGIMDLMNSTNRRASGDLEGSSQALRRSRAHFEAGGFPWGSFQDGYEAVNLLLRGKNEEARRALDTLGANFMEGAVYTGVDTAYWLSGKAHLGDSDILEQYRNYLSYVPERGRAMAAGAPVFLKGSIEALVLAGERDEAAKLYPLIADFVQSNLGLFDFAFGLHERFAGMAAAAARNWDAAEAHFEKALRLAEDLPHRVDQSRVRYWYARMLLDRATDGDAERAREMLAEARVMSDGMGLRGLIDQIDDLGAGSDASR